MDKLAYQIMTQKVIERLESGAIPWKQSWTGGGHPKNLVSRKPYRGINPFILSCMGYAQRYWVTFRQARELGGSVKKGEKACPVVFWNWREKEDKETGDKVRHAFLRCYNVFNVEQCEGLEEGVENLAVNKDAEPVRDCEKLVSDFLARDGKLRIEHGGASASYSPVNDLIRIPEFSHFANKEEYHSTLFHELVHATGAANRLDRLDEGRGKLASYSKEELVAEMGAA